LLDILSGETQGIQISRQKDDFPLSSGADKTGKNRYRHTSSIKKRADFSALNEI